MLIDFDRFRSHYGCVVADWCQHDWRGACRGKRGRLVRVRACVGMCVLAQAARDPEQRLMRAARAGARRYVLGLRAPWVRLRSPGVRVCRDAPIRDGHGRVPGTPVREPGRGAGPVGTWPGPDAAPPAPDHPRDRAHRSAPTGSNEPNAATAPAEQNAPNARPRHSSRTHRPRRPHPRSRPEAGRPHPRSYWRRRCRAIAAAVPPATAPTPAAAGMPTLAALRPVR
jgi:hypothetical protein